jgi:aspartate ammonia-lyase
LCEEKVDPIDDINKNQSTSDVCHTTLRITLVRECRKLYEELNQMIEVLSAKAFEFSSIQTIARTCLQDGMSIPVSSIFEGMAAALLRQRQRLEYCIEELHCINLGWTVVGSGTGASEEYRRHIICQLQAVTKMDVQWRECSYDAAQYPDDLVFTAQEIFNIISICAKFARDLRLLSSGPETGFREIKIPATQKGSSFFPGKVNPVIPEMLIQCQMLVKGNTSVIEEGLGLGEIHINLWEELMGFLLLDNLHMVTNSMHLFRIHCIEGIEVNEEVCESYARSSIPTVVNCKEKLGYQRTTQLIKELGLEEFVKRYR